MNKNRKIAYILGCFPFNTPPFVFNEIFALERLGFDINIFSIHESNEDEYQQDYKTMLKKTYYGHIPGSLPIIIFAHLFFMFMRTRIYFKLLWKYNEYGGKKAFLKGVYFAKISQKIEIQHIHAHFAHTATDVARLISLLTNIPFSFTAHQSDIHRSPIRLVQKLSAAEFVLTCTDGNKQYLSQKFGSQFGNKINNVYHGIDLERFDPIQSYSKPDIDILTVGHLLKYKGFNYLIDACNILRDKGMDFKCVILGDGEDRECLENQIIKLGLKNYVKMLGRVPYKNIKSYYERAKVFSLPVTVLDGNPHGIPNVIAEAMAMRLPVVVTDVPHIPELVTDKETGFMLPDNDPVALARTIAKLLADNKLREIIGQKARGKIVADFDFNKHTKRIAEFFHGKMPKECQ